MSAQGNLARLSVGQFAERFRNEMIPLSNTFSYFCASVPLTEEDLKEYLREPIASLPPAIATVLPRISIILVPYLEREGQPATEYICTERPPEDALSWASQVHLGKEEVLVFALKDQEVAEYHYRFYRRIAGLMSERWSETAREQYYALLRDEVRSAIHGEVDEESWNLKQQVMRKTLRKETKLFHDYARISFVDTLTLYLHGICCDIDVETGPRQLASRYLRRRLNLLHTLYPPPTGYAVFPEELKEKK